MPFWGFFWCARPLLFMMAEGCVSHSPDDWKKYFTVTCKQRRAKVRPYFMLFRIENQLVMKTFHSTFGDHRLFRSINNLDSGLYTLGLQAFPYVESIDWYMIWILHYSWNMSSIVALVTLCSAGQWGWCESEGSRLRVNWGKSVVLNIETLHKKTTANIYCLQKCIALAA